MVEEEGAVGDKYVVLFIDSDAYPRIVATGTDFCTSIPLLIN